MATPETIAEQASLQGINSDYTEKYGFHDAENYLYKAPKGLSEELVARSPSSRTSRSGCSTSA